MNSRNISGRRINLRTALIITICVLSVILIALGIVAIRFDSIFPSQSPDESLSLPEMVIQTVEEQGDLMKVTTSYGVFTYPFAFSDILTIEEINQEDCVGLAFNAYMNDSFERMYVLWINGDTGVYAGTLHSGGKTYRINVEILEPRADLEQDYVPTFYAAQETLNDVLLSMENNGIFEYAVGGNS